MSKLGAALKEKYKSPREVIRALGLDEALLKDDMEILMTAKPTKFAATACHLAAAVIAPLLAKDQKVDLMPAFAGLTRKTYDKAKVKLALDAALKGKIAKDADPHMGHVAAMLDHIDNMSKPEVADASVSEAQHNAMGAAAGGNSNLGIPQPVGKEFAEADKGKFDALPEFLKGKGLSEDDVAHVMGHFPPKAADEVASGSKPGNGPGPDVDVPSTLDANPLDNLKKVDEDEEKKKKEAAEAAAKDNMVTKDEMSVAIRAAVAAEQQRSRSLREALDKVRPLVGDLAMSFDSAAAVYRHVAKMRKVPNADTLHESALPTIIEMLPAISAKPREERLAQDADARSGFDKLYANAGRIQVGGV